MRNPALVADFISILTKPLGHHCFAGGPLHKRLENMQCFQFTNQTPSPGRYQQKTNPQKLPLPGGFLYGDFGPRRVVGILSHQPQGNQIATPTVPNPIEPAEYLR